jgi:hypothetical protein
MSTPDPPPPPTGAVAFERDVFIDKPAIVGARWWHKSLIAEDSKMRRRQMLKTIATVGGVAGAVGLFGLALTKIANAGSPTNVKLDTRTSLEMQRKYGWDFGARGEALVFNGLTTSPFDRSFLTLLPNVMRPATYSQFAVPTLLESLTATPTDTLTEPAEGVAAADAPLFRKLSDVIVPVETPQMRRAYRVGLAFARLCKGRDMRLALLVDLDGAESVAFAAGAAEVFEPVLLFDNWPHPRGVVPSHMVLAALAYYQPRFALQNKNRSPVNVSPVFLLDRSRLNAYSSDSTRFDNRYYAKPPPGRALAARGLKGLMYVVETRLSVPEPDDLELLAYEEPVVARAIALEDFSSPDSDNTPAYYGDSEETDQSIWANYPFVDGFLLPSGSRVASSTMKDYRFKPHKVSASELPAIGTTAVVVTAAGVLVAAALDRKGSMNRFSSSSGGWGG